MVSVTTKSKDCQGGISTFLHDNDYIAVLELLEDVEETPFKQGYKHILLMMIDRLNFSFKDAAQHLEKASHLFPDHPLFKETFLIFEQLQSIEKKEKDLALIIELYRQLDLYLDIQDIPSFLVRFYRAREALLYYMLDHGTLEPAQTIKRKSASSIYQVVDEVERQYLNNEIDGYLGVYFYLKSQNVARLLSVRNKSFIGHGRSSINELVMWDNYNGYKLESAEKSRIRFLADTTLLFKDMGIKVDEQLHKWNEFLLQNVELLTGSLHSHKQEHIHELILSGNFQSAQKLLPDNEETRELRELLLFGEQMLKLDITVPFGKKDGFELLEHILIQMHTNQSETAYVRMLAGVQQEKALPFIAYLHNYAAFLYERKDLIDFIVIYYRLAEEVLLHALGWDVSKWGKAFFIRNNATFFLDLPDRRPSRHYHRFLRLLKKEIQMIEKRTGRSISRGRPDQLRHLTKRDAYFAEIYFFFSRKPLEQLLDFRHDGVSGHGFADFTTDLFEETLNGQKPMDEIGRIMTKLSIHPTHSIFSLIQKACLWLLLEQKN